MPYALPWYWQIRARKEGFLKYSQNELIMILTLTAFYCVVLNAVQTLNFPANPPDAVYTMGVKILPLPSINCTIQIYTGNIILLWDKFIPARSQVCSYSLLQQLSRSALEETCSLTILPNYLWAPEWFCWYPSNNHGTFNPQNFKQKQL